MPVTDPSVGVTVPPLSEPSSMAKETRVAAGAVVNVSVLPDIVKSVLILYHTTER